MATRLPKRASAPHRQFRPREMPPAAEAVATRRKRLRPPRLLIYVDAVARHGSIRKAADALNVASSALNRQILDLEVDLGSALFERLPRGVRLTAAGEVFLAYTRQAISELKAVESQVEQLRGLVRGQVGIAAVESVAGELLPTVITQFHAKHPNVRFNVRIGAPEDLVTALIGDWFDLILTHYPPPRKHVAIAVAAEQALCALMVRDHPLATRKDLRLRDCLAYPLALGDATLAGRDPPLLQAKLILATRRGRVLPIAAASFVGTAQDRLGVTGAAGWRANALNSWR
jgi:DNA-binding transcriptional LysR family regulator